MNPIIILSDVFNYLVKEMGEDQFSLPLFIQNFTAGGSPPWQICTKDGIVGLLSAESGEFKISKHSENARHQAALDKILQKYKNKKEEADGKLADKVLAEINKPHNFKNGDILELGKESPNWRTIAFNPLR